MILSLENNPTWLNDQPFRPTGVPGVISVALLSGNGFPKALITTVQLVKTEAMVSHLKLKPLMVVELPLRLFVPSLRE